MPNPRRVRTLVGLVSLALLGVCGAVVWVNRGEIKLLLEFERLGRNPQGMLEYRHRKTGIVFRAARESAFTFATSAA